MPRTFDLDKIVAPYQKVVDRLSKRLNGEKGLYAKREALSAKVADLNTQIGEAEAELRQAERNLDWAKQAPAPGNAPLVTADEEFGDGVTLGEDEGEESLANPVGA